MLLESKLDDYKQRKEEFLKKVRNHEESIQGLRSSLLYQPLPADGLEMDAPTPSPIRSGAEGNGCRIYSLSPTLPTSGYSPGKEEIERGLSPQFMRKYPTTSTPNAASRF